MLKKVIQYFSVGAVLMFGVSCENEERTPQEFSEVKLEYFARKISKEEVNTIKPEVLKLAENYNAPLLTGRENDFEVLTDNVIYVQKGDYDSYTFPITRDNAEMEGFENLLISKQRDNTYKAFFVLYDVSLEDQIQYYNGEEMDFSDKVRFIEADTDFEHLITARDPFGGGILNECPFGSCCAPVQGESQGTGLPIINLEIIDCPEPDGSGGSNDSGDTEGNDNNDDEQEDSPSGGNDPNNNNDEEFPNRGGGDGGDGANTDLPCFDCDTDGTTPIVAPRILSELNSMISEGLIESYSFEDIGGILPSVSSVTELRNRLNNVESTFDIGNTLTTLQDGTKRLEGFIRIVGLFSFTSVDVNLFIDQQLKTDATPYMVTNLTTTQTGGGLLSNWELISFNVTHKSVNQSRLIITGRMRYGLDFLDQDFSVSELFRYELILNEETGELISIRGID